jgi:SHS2 domain-containing protein
MIEPSRARHAFVEHVGEAEVRVEAPTLEGLFEEAGRALAELTGPAEHEGATPAEPERVELRAVDRDALLFDWLNELVFRTETTKRRYDDLHVERLDEHELRATVRGTPVARPRQLVKAATLHGLHIARGPRGYATTVVFDV